MTFLWVVMAIVMLPAIVLLLSPLRKAHALYDQQRAYEANDTSAEQNVAIFQRRLASLEAAHARGDVSTTQFEEGKLELERSLLEDTATLAVRPLKSPLAGRLAVPLIAIGVVAISLFWYLEEGAEGDLALYAVQQELLNDPDVTTATYIQRLEEQAVRQPNNPNVWASLFPLYRDTGQEIQAIDALERLIALEGRVPALLAQLAQIRFFIAGRELTPDVQRLVNETLALDPRQPTVLGLLGIHAFDNGDYDGAIDRWRRALATVNDPTTADSLREGIQAAQERLGSEPDAALHGEGVRVHVTLDEALAGRVGEQATVFVTARDIDGELPPLAVVRAQVAELPMTVVLDNSVAMSPQARISQMNEVRLMVRVSPTGQATPQPGDLFGELSGVRVGALTQDAGDDNAAEVMINRVFE